MRTIFEYFNFETEIATLDETNLLYLVLSRFCDIDLHPNRVDNIRMGLIFEELIRRFNEAANETAGDYFTPREVIRLMVHLLFTEDDRLLSVPGTARELLDPACGTGGMLSEAQNYIRDHHPQAHLYVYGQDYNKRAYAIAASDLLIKEENPTKPPLSRVEYGDSFLADKYRDKTFDYFLANPPFGVDWKRQQKEIEREAKLGSLGRFEAGLPRISDGALLFLQHMVSKFEPYQPKECAKLEAILGPKTGEQILTDLAKWMDAQGALTTLRHGFKCYGRSLSIAYFRAAHGLNAELEARYAANRVGVTRQLRYSDRNANELDLVLSVNGLPVITLELKNPLTGQTAADAVRQYQEDRDSRELLFEFKRRTLAHFAVDTETVWMTTRLAGKATQFLPFNMGYKFGAGNPPDPQGRAYRTSYLWEEVLQRDSLLDLLARFLHLQIEERRTDTGQKVKKESLIFPRYHQLQAVRQLEAAAKEEGPGHNYLIEHSAGSGKSNTIAWVAHRLASLHDAQDRRVFDSVIVVTDRRVLDQQLQDTVYQFEHRQGVVQKIDADSRQLARALESAVPIIITTLQKFPFVGR